MRKSFLLILVIALLISSGLSGSLLDACTTFCLEAREQLVFGRNLDWNTGVGFVFVNKRNIGKSAVVYPPELPAEWISKYGSITFNQYGRELPMGGMNEAGLIVEQMWLGGTKFPEPDQRPALRELNWIQYQLDIHQTVEEIIASDADVRISPDSAPIHFLVCDRSGTKATIEFLKGKMVVHRATTMPVAALANNTYEESLEYLKRFQGFGGEEAIPTSMGSFNRFVWAAQGIEEYRNRGESTIEGIVDHAFEILKTVSQGSFTQWSIVYDPQNLAISYKTCQSPGIKTLSMDAFDFACKTPCQVLDIDDVESGNGAPHFIDYTTTINRKLIYAAWKKTSFLKDTPDLVLNILAAFPETFKNETAARTRKPKETEGD